MSDEQEYIVAIGAVRCVRCANYHFDDAAICWHCLDDGCRMTCCDQIVETVDGDIGL